MRTHTCEAVVRIYELKEGDKFIMSGFHTYVVTMKSDRIYYRICTDKANKLRMSMGLNSRQRVIKCT